MLLVAVTPWQPTLGLPRRRHSTKYPTEAKKLSIIGDLTEDKDAVQYIAQYLTYCPVAMAAYPGPGRHGCGKEQGLV